MRQGPEVEPECPGFEGANLQKSGLSPRVLSETAADLPFICGFHDVQRSSAVSERTAKQNETIGDEVVHEVRVLAPLLLLTDAPGVIPVLPVDQDQCEVGDRRRPNSTPARSWIAVPQRRFAGAAKLSMPSTINAFSRGFDCDITSS